MRYFHTTALLLTLLLIAGCSSKEVFTPEEPESGVKISGYIDEKIIDTTSDGAVLESGALLDGNGVVPIVIPDDYRYIGQSDGWAVSGKISGELLLQSIAEDRNETFELKKTVAAATVKGDIVAVLFASNEMALYSLSQKSLLFKERANKPVAVDNRIMNPYFLNELVLFLTLDGKVVIVNSETKQMLRSMMVGSDDMVNNIIYFNVIEDRVMAATSGQIYTFSGKEIRESYDLRDMVFDKDGVWIATKQGEVIALSPTLEVKAKKKFPFAHFLAMIATDKKLYLLEKAGYLIVIDKSFDAVKVQRVEMEDGFVFTAGKRFYFAVSPHDDEFGLTYSHKFSDKTAYIDIE